MNMVMLCFGTTLLTLSIIIFIRMDKQSKRKMKPSLRVERKIKTPEQKELETFETWLAAAFAAIIGYLA